jgi:hypothetical protein
MQESDPLFDCCIHTLRKVIEDQKKLITYLRLDYAELEKQYDKLEEENRKLKILVSGVLTKGPRNV